MRIARPNTGFTLVEIALSLLVLSVGLLAMFGLMPAGLKTNKQAIDDTVATMFAQEAMNGFKAIADVTPWDEIMNIQVEARSPQKWAMTSQQEIRPNQNEDWQIASYRPASMPDAEDFSVRYRLWVNDYPGQITKRKTILLEVMAGEFGPTNALVRFYSELYNSNPHL